MGLNTSHGCWDGPYSSFDRFRKKIAEMLDFDLSSMQGFRGDKSWDGVCSDGWKVLFCHSDCDGVITVEESKLLLPEMKNDLERFTLIMMVENDNEGSDDYYVGKYKTFMEGVELAIKENESIEFD